MRGCPRRIVAALALGVTLGLAGALAGCETSMDLLDKTASIDETWVKVDPAGVGPLDGKIAADPARLLALMPDYTSGSVLISQETTTANAVVLFHPSNGGSVQVLQVLAGPDGKIAEIHGVARQVRGPAGERPGMAFIDTGTDPATCRRGTTLWTGLIICRSSAAKNVLLTFALPGSVPASAMLPVGDDLTSSELQRIIWTRGE